MQNPPSAPNMYERLAEGLVKAERQAQASVRRSPPGHSAELPSGCAMGPATSDGHSGARGRLLPASTMILIIVCAFCARSASRALLPGPRLRLSDGVGGGFATSLRDVRDSVDAALSSVSNAAQRVPAISAPSHGSSSSRATRPRRALRPFTMAAHREDCSGESTRARLRRVTRCDLDWAHEAPRCESCCSPVAPAALSSTVAPDAPLAPSLTQLARDPLRHLYTDALAQRALVSRPRPSRQSGRPTSATALSMAVVDPVAVIGASAPARRSSPC